LKHFCAIREFAWNRLAQNWTSLFLLSTFLSFECWCKLVAFRFPSLRPTFPWKSFHLISYTVLLVRIFLSVSVSCALFRFTLVVLPFLPLFKGSCQAGSSCVRFQLQSSYGFDIFNFIYIASFVLLLSLHFYRLFLLLTDLLCGYETNKISFSYKLIFKWM